MTTEIDLSFRDPRKAGLVNRHFKDLLAAGGQTGFRASAGSTAGLVDLSAGVLLTEEGVRIAETTEQADFNSASPISTNSTGNDRLDAVVLHYEFGESIPQPIVTYYVVEDYPSHSWLDGEYVLAILIVPDTTNTPAKYIHTSRHMDAWLTAPEPELGIAGGVKNRIVVADGVTAFADLTGVEGIQAAIDELSLRGGGLVELIGASWPVEYTTPHSGSIILKSSVVIDGGGVGLAKSKYQNPTALFKAEWGNNTNGDTIAGTSRLEEAGVDFRDWGITSAVAIQGGADAGIYEIYFAADGYCLLRDPDSLAPASFTGSTGQPHVTLPRFIGLRNLRIDADGLSSAAIVLGGVSNVNIDDLTIFNNGSPIPNAILSSGDNRICKVRHCFIADAFTYALDLGNDAKEISEWAIHDNIFLADVRIQTTAGFNFWYNNFAGAALTLPAATGDYNHPFSVQHNIDGTHDVAEFAGDGLEDDGSGDLQLAENGVWRREVAEGSNLIINPTARRGNAFWWDAGAGGSVNDPGYATPANFSDATHWTTIGGQGPIWQFAGASGSFLGDLNERIPITGNVSLVLSALIWIQSHVAGDMAIAIVCYDAAGNWLSTIAQTTLSASTAGPLLFEATGVTHASTAYIRVRKWMTPAWNSSFLLVGRMKCENGIIATPYSDESSMGQYLSCRYHMTAAGETTGPIASGVSTVIDFNIKDFDDPGADRGSVDDGGANRWRYTADRYQKLDISVKIEGDFSVILGAGEEVWLSIRKNGALYSRLDYILGDIITIVAAGNFPLQGSDTIELNKGEYFDVLFKQTSGGNYAFNTAQAAYNYLSINEITT